MNPYLISNIYLLLCSCSGLIFGLHGRFGGKKSPGYFYFVLSAILSTVLSRLYYVITIALYGGLPQTFNLGFLGYAAALLFICMANYGSIDKLADDRRTLPMRYRIIPVIVPVIELAAAILAVIYSGISMSIRLFFLLFSVIAGFAGYINVKHLIIPDVDFGIVKSIRGYNLIAFLVGLLSIAEIGFSVYGYNRAIIFVQIVLGVFYAALVPVLSREVKKWTI